MAETGQISAWIAFFVGLYALAAGVGELRSPGGWSVMLKEFERNASLRFLTGLVTLALGATIYLVNPWRTDDWLAIAVSVIGGIAIAEGLLILAAGERFLNFGRMMLGRGGRVWAGLSALLGIALVAVALSRLHTF
jgi:sterol desaturase/sphingolipid hydroxylase (fatty acid hydroxylase superfamily)